VASSSARSGFERHLRATPAFPEPELVHGFRLIRRHPEPRAGPLWISNSPARRNSVTPNTAI